jgi:nitroimidazol reductase NimA-like FMN-containing flavoprotein (pyridoxamine 5'-phosphate oxidase superfamily)
MSDFKRTERTQVKRLPDRGAYDTETVFPILDEGLICHVGFSVEGQPFVIPTGYARVGDTLYIHGSAASRMLRTLAEGIQVCVTVTLLDGLVLARAAFHHSMNYRSVVILGRATLVEDRAEKIKALEAFTEHVVRGRWNDVRSPTETELKATTVLASGPPKDDAEDYQLPIWAGVVPLTIIPGAPITDPRLISRIEAPAYAKKYSR